MAAGTRWDIAFASAVVVTQCRLLSSHSQAPLHCPPIGRIDPMPGITDRESGAFAHPAGLKVHLPVAPVCSSSYGPLLSCINGTTSATCPRTPMSYTGTWFQLMADHSAWYVPQEIAYGYNQGYNPDNTMTELPFYRIGCCHWSIQAQSGKWETDDATGNADCR